MTESPKVNLSKFTTLTLTDRSKKINSHLLPKRSGRKSNSSLLNPETSINFKSIDDTSLPKIETSKRKIKKGSFLESWLDEALDTNDPQVETQKKNEVDGGMFKTLHKFELDKRYLQSQNIPSEVIEKMYNNLYIYTHGINNIFSDLSKYVKSTKNS